MKKTNRFGMPVVEVTAPDGSKSLWAVAVAYGAAVETYQERYLRK
jgi:hypothetical protein